MPDSSQLREALKRVATTLKAAEIPFALAGSYALWAHGAPESDHDVDFMIPERLADEAARAMSDAGLTVVRPPEDWLLKVATDGVIVDLLHRAAGTPVTAEYLARAEVFEVLSVQMPVLSALDVLAGKLRAMSEHYCDFGRLLPAARAVREQVDWDVMRGVVADNDFAVAFLFLADRLGISAGEPAVPTRAESPHDDGTARRTGLRGGRHVDGGPGAATGVPDLARDEVRGAHR
jgi:hypothetical protein